MDNRRAARFCSRLHVKLSHESTTSWGILCDVSEEGLFIKSNRDFKVETLLRIEIIMPDNTSSLLKGMVRRKVELSETHRRYGLGVSIIDKDLSYRNFVDYLREIAGAQSCTSG